MIMWLKPPPESTLRCPLLIHIYTHVGVDAPCGRGIPDHQAAHPLSSQYLRDQQSHLFQQLGRDIKPVSEKEKS